MKRFYDKATIVATDRGFVVELDGRELKTPEKRQNIIPTRALAEAICQEWDRQTDKINPDSMPVTRLQNSVIDRVECRRDSLIDDLVKYAATDLLCYRAAVPEALARKQEQVWQPLLDWLHHHHGVTLKVTTGIIHIEQDQAALAQTGKLLHGLDSFRLMAFYTIATLCGSVAVALNVIGGNITAEQAWAAAQLDENYQTDQWGRDDEARTRQDNIRTELDAAIRFLSLL